MLLTLSKGSIPVAKMVGTNEDESAFTHILSRMPFPLPAVCHSGDMKAIRAFTEEQLQALHVLPTGNRKERRRFVYCIATRIQWVADCWTIANFNDEGPHEASKLRANALRNVAHAYLYHTWYRERFSDLIKRTESGPTLVSSGIDLDLGEISSLLPAQDIAYSAMDHVLSLWVREEMDPGAYLLPTWFGLQAWRDSSIAVKLARRTWSGHRILAPVRLESTWILAAFDVDGSSV
jgi:hypothetical protein